VSMSQCAADGVVRKFARTKFEVDSNGFPLSYAFREYEWMESKRFTSAISLEEPRTKGIQRIPHCHIHKREYASCSQCGIAET